MLPWLVLSLIVMAWVSVNQVLDVMYGLTTTEKFYFIITIGKIEHKIVLNRICTAKI